METVIWRLCIFIPQCISFYNKNLQNSKNEAIADTVTDVQRWKLNFQSTESFLS